MHAVHRVADVDDLFEAFHLDAEDLQGRLEVRIIDNSSFFGGMRNHHVTPPALDGAEGSARLLPTKTHF